MILCLFWHGRRITDIRKLWERVGSFSGEHGRFGKKEAAKSKQGRRERAPRTKYHAKLLTTVFSFSTCILRGNHTWVRGPDSSTKKNVFENATRCGLQVMYTCG